MLKPLDWDSDFFGIKTARIDASDLSENQLLEEIKKSVESNFSLVYIFAPHDDASLKKIILNGGGKLADEKVTYLIKSSSVDPVSSEFIHSCLGSEIDEDLESLAIESGKYSRFRIDDRIPRNKFEDLYRLWIQNSLSGVFAKEVYVFEEDGEKLGMVSMDIRNGAGWIGIIAINENYRGKSIGKLLMHAAIRYCKEKHAEILNVQTQKANNVSCEFYEKLGFTVRNIEDVYHL